MQQVQQLHQDIDSLPNEAQGLLFDFVQILKKRYLVSGQNNISVMNLEIVAQMPSHYRRISLSKTSLISLA